MGQEAIAETLIHALEQNKIAPAYLFCGPRGTGKTSSARILAKSLNCLEADGPTPSPCGRCEVCRAVNAGSALDIVEIDAASNTGVDNIRELIERAQFAPVQCRYKAYVIDECHMLSVAAFNALLKTLEEPPDRVVFVLATTDPQRVLPTIISRCQRFDFRRIPLPSMVKHLGYIAEQESININEAAVQLVAQISQGGLRDAESLLDQLSLRADEISVEAVWDLVGAVPERDLLNLVRAIAADDGTILIERARNLMDKGREPLIVLQSLVGFYRDLLIAKSAPTRADMVAITPPTWEEMTAFAQKLSVPHLLTAQQKLQAAEVQVKNTTQPRLWLEITLTSLLPSALAASQLEGKTAAHATVQATVQSVLSVANPPAIPSVPAQTNQAVISQKKTAAISTADSSKTENLSKPEDSSKTEDLSAKAGANTEAAKQVDSVADSPIDASVTKTEEVSESSTSGANGVAFGRLEELWTQVLAALQPRATQMLMSQQGFLLAFDGVSAKVAFCSMPLQKAAQQRIPNLEQAFETVFNRPIKVLLEVHQRPSENEKSTSEASAPINPRAANPSSNIPPSHNVAPTQTVTHEPPVAEPSPPREENAEPATKGKRADMSPPYSPPASDNSPSAPAERPSPDQWAVNQDQDNIKRFAQFFNGQIVELDDDDLVDGSGHSSDGGSQRKKRSDKSSEPGPDVPF